MKRTKNQERAINEKISNIIVSAGAGSGKTSVLTSRIIKNIKEDNVNLDEVLILTFTRPAASEMKERIKKAIYQDDKIRLLLPKVDTAHIETYDAFRLFLVKKYSDKLGLANNISLADEDIMFLKKNEFLQEILNNYYKNNDELIKKCVYYYCKKDDKSLIDIIFRISELVTNKDASYIEEYKSKFLTFDFLNSIKESYFNLIDEYRLKLKIIKGKIYDSNLISSFERVFNELLNAKNLEEIIESINSINGSKLSSSKVIDENDANLKEEIKSIKKELIPLLKIDLNILEKFDFPLHQELIPFLLKIAFELNERLFQFKKEKNCFTFNDIAKLSIKLLEENESIRLKIKNKLKVIMVDEYQDTSDDQERFISLIENNNVFLVGDVKQSIYGFREANPLNFIKKFEHYKNDKSCTAINMNENFRSRHEITGFINELFSNIMTSEFGGVNYKETEMILSKNRGYYDNPIDEFRHGFSKIEIDAENSNDAREKEAIQIAENIIKRLEKNQLVYDRDQSKCRKIEYKDFAILISTSKSFSIYEKVFSNYGIPLNIISDESLLEDEAIITLISILKFVNLTLNENLLDKKNTNKLLHAYISIIRSFLFSYDDQKIYELINKELYKEDIIFIKLNKFVYDVKDLSLKDLLLATINEFNFVEKTSRLDDALKNINKISMLFEKTIQMDELGYTLDEYIEYLNNLNKYKLTIESKKGVSSPNSVTLSTIHASKGLEYHVCYFPELGGRKRSDSDSFIMSQEHGIWLYFLSNKNKDANYKPYFKPAFSKSDNKEKSEKLRLLYVALTRCEEEGVFLISNIGKKRKATEFLEFIEMANIEIKEDEYKGIRFLRKPIIIKENDESIEIRENKIQFDKIENNKIKASKTLDEEENENVREALEYGTHMHLLMEIVDINNKNTSFIENKEERKKIDTILNNSIFDNAHNARIFKEYQFYDKENNLNGIIDLMLVYNDHIDIIDYKLKKIDDDSYIRQLELYKNYVLRVFKRKVNGYLLAINTNEIRRVV